MESHVEVYFAEAITKINDAKLNVVVREAKQLIRNHRNEKFYSYLSNISPDKDTR